jgi:hypothetical protein
MLDHKREVSTQLKVLRILGIPRLSKERFRKLPETLTTLDCYMSSQRPKSRVDQVLIAFTCCRAGPRPTQSLPNLAEPDSGKMKAIRDAVGRLRDSAGEVEPSLNLTNSPSEPTLEDDPSLFFAISTKNWEEAERLMDLRVGFNFRKVGLSFAFVATSTNRLNLAEWNNCLALRGPKTCTIQHH